MVVVVSGTVEVVVVVVVVEVVVDVDVVDCSGMVGSGANDVLVGTEEVVVVVDVVLVEFSTEFVVAGTVFDVEVS